MLYKMGMIDLQMILDWLHEETGLNLPESHHDFILQSFYVMMEEVERNLEKIRPGRTGNAEAFFHDLMTNPALKEKFIGLVTLTETYFFREDKQYKLIQDRLVKQMAAEKDHLNVWSVTCSSGEEAISAYILLEEYRRLSGRMEFDIYATDVNGIALERFQDGHYGPNSLRADGSEFHPLLNDFVERRERTYTLRRDVYERLHILKANILMDDLHELPDNMDLVFFRNTLIYMNQKNKDRAIRKIVDKMNPGAFLFVSISEVPHIEHPDLDHCEYQGVYYLEKKRDAIAGHTSGVSHKYILPTGEEDLDHSKTISRLYEEDHALVEVDPLTVPLPGEKPGRTLMTMIDLINEGDFVKSRRFLDDVKKQHGENDLTYFFEGIISRLQGYMSVAENSFRSALKINKQFWPSHYYLGKILETKDPRGAQNSFQICRDIIGSTPEDRKNRYSSILENFDDSYFFQLCDMYLKKFFGDQS